MARVAHGFGCVAHDIRLACSCVVRAKKFPSQIGFQVGARSE